MRHTLCSHVICLTSNWSMGVYILVLGRAVFQGRSLSSISNLILTRSWTFEATSIIPSINVIPDFVLSSVICANACVQIKTTCMVLTLGRSISAGACDGEMTISDPNVNHRQEHLCTAVCAAPGICEIETAPHSIEATFTGKNETFQYTKVRCLASSVRSGIDPLAVFSRFVRVFVYLPPLT